MNGDKLNGVRREASKHFRDKMRKYFKGKINELEINSKTEVIIQNFIES
jgi:hypothetical protein